jgi:hypothetical protein
VPREPKNWPTHKPTVISGMSVKTTAITVITNDEARFGFFDLRGKSLRVILLVLMIVNSTRVVVV